MTRRLLADFGALNLIPSFAISARVSSPGTRRAIPPPPRRPCWQASALTSRFAPEDTLGNLPARGSRRDGTVGTERQARPTATRYETRLTPDLKWVTYTTCSDEKGEYHG
jgi:hypothetical protein